MSSSPSNRVPNQSAFHIHANIHSANAGNGQQIQREHLPHVSLASVPHGAVSSRFYPTPINLAIEKAALSRSNSPPGSPGSNSSLSSSRASPSTSFIPRLADRYRASKAAAAAASSSFSSSALRLSAASHQSQLAAIAAVVSRSNQQHQYHQQHKQPILNLIGSPPASPLPISNQTYQSASSPIHRVKPSPSNPSTSNSSFSNYVFPEHHNLINNQHQSMNAPANQRVAYLASPSPSSSMSAQSEPHFSRPSSIDFSHEVDEREWYPSDRHRKSDDFFESELDMYQIEENLQYYGLGDGFALPPGQNYQDSNLDDFDDARSEAFSQMSREAFDPFAQSDSDVESSFSQPEPQSRHSDGATFGANAQSPTSSQESSLSNSRSPSSLGHSFSNQFVGGNFSGHVASFFHQGSESGRQTPVFRPQLIGLGTLVLRDGLQLLPQTPVSGTATPKLLPFSTLSRSDSIEWSRHPAYLRFRSIGGQSGASSVAGGVDSLIPRSQLDSLNASHDSSALHSPSLAAMPSLKGPADLDRDISAASISPLVLSASISASSSSFSSSSCSPQSFSIPASPSLREQILIQQRQKQNEDYLNQHAFQLSAACEISRTPSPPSRHESRLHHTPFATTFAKSSYSSPSSSSTFPSFAPMSTPPPPPRLIGSASSPSSGNHVYVPTVPAAGSAKHSRHSLHGPISSRTRPSNRIGGFLNKPLTVDSSTQLASSAFQPSHDLSSSSPTADDEFLSSSPRRDSLPVDLSSSFQENLNPAIQENSAQLSQPEDLLPSLSRDLDQVSSSTFAILNPSTISRNSEEATLTSAFSSLRINSDQLHQTAICIASHQPENSARSPTSVSSLTTSSNSAFSLPAVSSQAETKFDSEVDSDIEDEKLAEKLRVACDPSKFFNESCGWLNPKRARRFGLDAQGIAWSRMPMSRSKYWQHRQRHMLAFRNLDVPLIPTPQQLASPACISKIHTPMDFMADSSTSSSSALASSQHQVEIDPDSPRAIEAANFPQFASSSASSSSSSRSHESPFFEWTFGTRQVKPSIQHFQLHHALAVPWPHTVFYVDALGGGIRSFCTQTRRISSHLELPFAAVGDFGMQCSTLHVGFGRILAIGGMSGEVGVKDLQTGSIVGRTREQLRPDSQPSALCTSISSLRSVTGSPRLLLSSNDACAFSIDPETMQVVDSYHTEWAVNRAVACPVNHHHFSSLQSLKSHSYSKIPVFDELAAADLSWKEVADCYFDWSSAHISASDLASNNHPVQNVLLDFDHIGEPWLIPDPTSDSVSTQWWQSEIQQQHRQLSSPSGSSSDLEGVEFHQCDFSSASRLLCLVGDVRETLLLDSSSGRPVATLHGHRDFSCAAAFSPCGGYLATGNQDRTCRVHDLRMLSRALFVLPTGRGAVRTVSFSHSGRWLGVAEDSDCVRLYDFQRDCSVVQEIKFFGDCAGLDFAPGDERLYIGVDDAEHPCLLEFKNPISP